MRWRRSSSRTSARRTRSASSSRTPTTGTSRSSRPCGPSRRPRPSTSPGPTASSATTCGWRSTTRGRRRRGTCTSPCTCPRGTRTRGSTCSRARTSCLSSPRTRRRWSTGRCGASWTPRSPSTPSGRRTTHSSQSRCPRPSPGWRGGRFSGATATARGAWSSRTPCVRTRTTTSWTLSSPSGSRGTTCASRSLATGWQWRCATRCRSCVRSGRLPRTRPRARRRCRAWWTARSARGAWTTGGTRAASRPRC
mmetsp:Transcript_2115/g.7337  ORF Transcript_2115/g.7337 Transcript_2115/m.7337 type:complete len:251 (+) Transcript_2115:417-1169(+)